MRMQPSRGISVHSALEKNEPACHVGEAEDTKNFAEGDTRGANDVLASLSEPTSPKFPFPSYFLSPLPSVAITTKGISECPAFFFFIPTAPTFGMGLKTLPVHSVHRSHVMAEIAE